MTKKELIDKLAELGIEADPRDNYSILKSKYSNAMAEIRKEEAVEVAAEATEAEEETVDEDVYDLEDEKPARPKKESNIVVQGSVKTFKWVTVDKARLKALEANGQIVGYNPVTGKAMIKV